MDSRPNRTDAALTVSTDAAFLNSVVNDPSVYPFVKVGSTGVLDMTALVSNTANVFLANEFGGFLFVRTEDEYTYQVHTQFLPAGRGKAAVKAATYAAAFMFTRTDALRLDTLVSPDNRSADWLTRRMGFTRWGETVQQGINFNYYALTIKQWARTLDLCQSQFH